MSEDRGNYGWSYQPRPMRGATVRIGLSLLVLRHMMNDDATESASDQPQMAGESGRGRGRGMKGIRKERRKNKGTFVVIVLLLLSTVSVRVCSLRSSLRPSIRSTDRPTDRQTEGGISSCRYNFILYQNLSSLYNEASAVQTTEYVCE